MKISNLKTLIYASALLSLSLNAQWSATGSLSDRSNALVEYNSNLYAGGTFLQADGNTVNYIAKWNGTAWSSLLTGVNDRVNALATYSNELYVAGDFLTAGGSPASRIAKWNGTAWSALPTHTAIVGPAHALCVFNNELYVEASSGGNSTGSVLKWDGASWTFITSFDDRVEKLEVFANELYAVGKFTMVGSTPANRIAKYNGTTWSAAGSGFDNNVYTIASYGSELYVGGSFSMSGSTPVPNIAKWSGTSWTPVGTGPDGWLLALKVYNGRLYAAGTFNNAGGNSAKNIASWNGSSWSPLAGGTDNLVFSLGTFNGDLFVSGSFGMAGTTSVTNIAKWNEIAAPNAIHKNFMNDNNVYAYPNPAKDLLYLSANQNSEVTIYNCLGQIVKVISLNEENTITISDLQPGLYFLKEAHSENIIKFFKE